MPPRKAATTPSLYGIHRCHCHRPPRRSPREVFDAGEGPRWLSDHDPPWPGRFIRRDLPRTGARTLSRRRAGGLYRVGNWSLAPPITLPADCREADAVVFDLALASEWSLNFGSNDPNRS